MTQTQLIERYRTALERINVIAYSEPKLANVTEFKSEIQYVILRIARAALSECPEYPKGVQGTFIEESK